jgi:hypothetical protein
VRGPSAHVFDESLLAHDDVDYVAEPGLADEVQAALRLAPYLVEGVPSGEEVGDGVVAAVTSNAEVTSFNAGAKCCPNLVKGGLYRLCP